MKVLLLAIGKTSTRFVADGIAEYCKRLSRYIPFEIKCLNDAKTPATSTNRSRSRKRGK